MSDGSDNGILRTAGLRRNHAAVAPPAMPEHVRSGSWLRENAAPRYQALWFSAFGDFQLRQAPLAA